MRMNTSGATSSTTAATAAALMMRMMMSVVGMMRVVEGNGADVVDGVDGVVVMRRRSGKIPRRQIVMKTLERIRRLKVAHRRMHHF